MAFSGRSSTVSKALQLDDPTINSTLDSYDGHGNTTNSSASLSTETDSDTGSDPFSVSTTRQDQHHRHHRVNGSDDDSGEHSGSDLSSEMSDFSLTDTASLGGDSSRGEFAQSPTSQTIARIQLRRKMRQKKFIRKGKEDAQRCKDAFRLGGTPTLRDYGRMKSYFHCENTDNACLSLRHEWRCFWGYVLHLRDSIDEDRLPWTTDFFALRKMRWPRNKKEAMSRLNLNIPYYAANYLEIFYTVTLPFLFFYNFPFFLVVLVTCVFIHSISMRRKELHCYAKTATLLGREISYHTLGHVLLLCQAVLFMFFDGLTTVALVLLLNAAIVVPHALLRRTTFFDDEDMEKCRPKLGQYALTLLFLALCYLEGAADNESCANLNKTDGKLAPSRPACGAADCPQTKADAAERNAPSTDAAVEDVAPEKLSKVIAEATGMDLEEINTAVAAARRNPSLANTAAHSAKGQESAKKAGMAASSSSASLASNAVMSAAAQAVKEEAGMAKLLGALERERVAKAPSPPR